MRICDKKSDILIKWFILEFERQVTQENSINKRIPVIFLSALKHLIGKNIEPFRVFFYKTVLEEYKIEAITYDCL